MLWFLVEGSSSKENTMDRWSRSAKKPLSSSVFEVSCRRHPLLPGLLSLIVAVLISTNVVFAQQDTTQGNTMGSAGGQSAAPGGSAPPMLKRAFLPEEEPLLLSTRPIPHRTTLEHERAKDQAERGQSPGTTKPVLSPSAVSPSTGVQATTVTPSGTDLAPSAPFFGGSFGGVVDTGQFPPDVSIAAGPKNIVVATNGRVNVFRKNGSLVPAASRGLFGFFSSLGTVASDGPFDPWLRYDEYINRFWLFAVSENDSPQRSTFLIGLSNTDDATQGWTLFAIDATLNGNTATSNWCDYPKLGVDAQAIYLTCNMFSFPSTTGSFQYAKVRVMTKDQFVNNTCCFWWDFWNLREDFLGITASFTVQPAYMHGANAANGEFLIDAHTFCIFCPPNTLEVWHITNAQRCCVPGSQSSPDLNQESHDVGNFPSPPNARQSGSTTRIDTGDTRLLFAFWKGGFLSTGQNLACNSGADACIAFTELNVSGFPTISTVNDFAYQTTGVDYFYPAVDVNAAGDKTMVFSRSSASEFAGASYIGIPASSTCTNCVNGPETVLAAGQNTYVRLEGPPLNRNRWGDYLGAAADPDGVGIWIHGQFAAATANTWGTQVGLTYEALDTTPPVTTAQLSPMPNVFGWNGGDVNVTLNATDNASGLLEITYRASGAQIIASTTVSGATTSFMITAEGVTTITFFAEDNAGNQETPKTVIVRIDRTPPTITAPPNVTAGTGPGAALCSAVVSDATLGSAIASDNSGIATIFRSGVPAGNVFPVGATSVVYTATDFVGLMASATQTVTVNDTTPPVLSTPANVTVNATSPAGAVVTYPLPAATDNCPTVSAACTPPSGSTFAIGTSTVTCTATDAAGNGANKTFQVTVIGAAGQTTDLSTLVSSFGLDHGTENSLLTKLGNALAAINGGNVGSACAHLSSFINEVQAQTGKKITAAQAAQLIAAANQIKAVLGCP